MTNTVYSSASRETSANADMILKRNQKFLSKDGRETIFVANIGMPNASFKEEARKFANGLINSHGGVIYFGINTDGTISGTKITRKAEDDYRLAIDHVFGAMQPFVSSNHYRLAFLPVAEGSASPQYTVIELKVSVGEIGEIYEDGRMKVYLVDDKRLVGPLYPQELKELILLKYKESLEGAEAAARFATPNLAVARVKAKAAQDGKEKCTAQDVDVTNQNTALVKRALSKIDEEPTPKLTPRSGLEATSIPGTEKAVSNPVTPKPVPKPVPKTISKPVVKPAPKPALKLAPKPAPKKAPKPVSRPKPTPRPVHSYRHTNHVFNDMPIRHQPYQPYQAFRIAPLMNCFPNQGYNQPPPLRMHNNNNHMPIIPNYTNYFHQRNPVNYNTTFF